MESSPGPSSRVLLLDGNLGSSDEAVVVSRKQKVILSLNVILRAKCVTINKLGDCTDKMLNYKIIHV